MLLTVNVKNAIWREGCPDRPGHQHRPQFWAVVDIPDYHFMREDQIDTAIGEALIDQCNCCIKNCNISIIESIELEENFERPEEGEEEED